MHLPYLLSFVFYSTKCMNLEIIGTVTLDLKIYNIENNRKSAQNGDISKGNSESEEIGNESVLKFHKNKISNVTAAPLVECLYQYPQQDQIDAMLSNMMNELVKVFITAPEFMKDIEISRRKQGSRFRVVSETNTGFLEFIYNNMTKEYRDFYNNSILRVDRSGFDTCQHQEEIKQMWKDLLEKSLDGLRRASLKCVTEYLRVQNRTTDTRTRNKLMQFLLREVKRIRANQLHLLCDKFQLCYNELL